MHKNVVNWETLDFLSFLVSFWGHFDHSQKNPKISSKLYRKKLNLCELNPVGDTLQFEYKFGT